MQNQNIDLFKDIEITTVQKYTDMTDLLWVVYTPSKKRACLLSSSNTSILNRN